MNQNSTNIFIAALLSLLVVISFQFFYQKPQQEAARSQYLAQQVAQQEKGPTLNAAGALRDRSEVIKENQRVAIATPEMTGSINLKGARLDDLALIGYRETMATDSPSITLLSPSGSAAPHMAYYTEFSWLADAGVTVPTAETLWTAEGKTLSPGQSVKLTWKNGQGLAFERTITVDDKSMFTITDRVTNGGAAAVQLYPFGTVARQGLPHEDTRSSVVLEGGIGVLDGKLEEYKYKKLMDGDKAALESKGGWLGITDKYWLVAMVPPQDEKLTAEFKYNRAGAVAEDMGFFQTDFRGAPVTLAPGAATERTVHLFAGAKRVSLLDRYADVYNIPHFDKAIDFGWFYFLTRPFLYLLEFLANAVGGLGIAILLFTVLLKLATLPLSQKSYHSMSRMKTLQPEIQKIQERFAEDKMRQSQEMMELYKREKVSPMSGCVPTLIQIPIFFALYKVLYVNIEMRHAPFYGWIHDMSAADPTNMFTLFGLVPWNAPLFLQIGAWPLLMGISMFMQQKLSPQPPDKSQARMFMFMPIMFTYMLAHMPAGLVIYWTWSNLLGIAQQWYIMKSDARRKAKASA